MEDNRLSPTFAASKEISMQTVDSTDPFYTPKVVEDIRKSILLRIGKDRDVSRLERICDLLSSEMVSPTVLTDEQLSARESGAAYFNVREIDTLRKQLLQLVSTCGLNVMEEIFSYYDHEGMSFKDAYMDAKASTLAMYPSDAVEELAEVNFMIDRDPEPDDWHEPQTSDEWEALDKELNGASDYISDKEFWRHFEKILS